MLPYLNLGLIGLPTSPLVVLFGAWLGLYAVDRAARRLGRDPEAMYGLAGAALVAGFVGARLAFVLTHWSSYDDNLLGILWPLNSGYNAAGGLLIAAAAAFFYARWKRLAVWDALDCLAPGLLVWLVSLSLADFLGGTGYGSLTNVPWGISTYGVRRHPVQVYEMLAGAAALAAWWWVSRPGRGRAPGEAWWLAIAVYAAGRLFVDAFREDAAVVLGGYHLAQLVALVALLAALVMLARSAAAPVPAAD